MTREEAIKKIRGYLTDCLPMDCADEIDEIIEALEQQKVGRWGTELVEGEDWKGRKRRYYQPISCSECHKPNGVETKYCPNCGSRMESEE